MSGPLQGVRVVEIAAIGPAPFCGMVLADLGADVIRVDRADAAAPGHTKTSRHDLMCRGKRSIAVDLKHERGVDVVLRLVEGSAALIEGFRPGVTERLGIGPAPCLARNPRLTYGRMTGWGQEGALSARSGHDIDYIALSGALAAIGPEDRPTPPLNLVGDFGGGGMLLAVGVLAGVIHARESGQGQVVDAAMVDGSALLTTAMHGHIAEGWWVPATRESNLLDGGAPFYAVYEARDGGHVAVGALEPQFYQLLLEGLEIAPDSLPDRTDRSSWPRIRSVFAARFLERPRDEWAGIFSGIDACVAPVLNAVEAPKHPHNRGRSVFVEVEGVLQPAPAPRFDRTPAGIPEGPPFPGRDTDEVLAGLGFSQEQAGMLRRVGAVA
ncbi:MAG TPA: CaiB/BaiF CoA-transferase family protein [Acidimicrobiia bacterium]|nr:CaiB/BaiF CoA-transferase family protein [Acidimicrobiia bacterium]